MLPSLGTGCDSRAPAHRHYPGRNVRQYADIRGLIAIRVLCLAGQTSAEPCTHALPWSQCASVSQTSSGGAIRVLCWQVRRRQNLPTDITFITLGIRILPMLITVDVLLCSASLHTAA